MNSSMLPPKVVAIVEAAIEFYGASGGSPALIAAKKLDAAVEEYLKDGAKQ